MNLFRRARRKATTSPIRFSVESPQEDEALEGLQLLIAGWVFADRDPVSAVEVTIDGRRVGSAEVGLARGDVAAQHRRSPHAASSGFRYLLDVAALAGGSAHPTLGLRVVRAGGSHRNFWECRLPPPGVFCAIDDPVDRAVVHGSAFDVAGWAHSPLSAVHGVEVVVDGELQGWARVGLRRPDVGMLFESDPAAVHSGFHLGVNLGDGVGDEAEVVVRAHFDDGSSREVGRRTLLVADVVAGDVDLATGATVHRGRLPLSGTVAVGPAGGRVRLVVDGETLAERSVAPTPDGTGEWFAEVDLAGVDADEVGLEVRVAGRRGVWRTVARRDIALLDVGEDQWEGALDTPGQATRDAIIVAGWVLSPRSEVDRVELLLNGENVGIARLGMARPDVAQISRLAEAPIAGFEAALDLSLVSPDESHLTLSAVAHDVSGNSATLVGRSIALVDGAALDESDQERAAVLRARTGLRIPISRTLDGPPRVLVFTHDLGYGGGQLYLSELLFQMVADRAAKPVVVSPKDGPLRGDLELRDIPVHIAGDFPVDDIDGYEGWVAARASWAHGQRFDAVLCNTLGTFAGVDVGSRLGLPVVWAVHESFPLPVFLRVAYHERDLHPYVRDRLQAAMMTAASVVFEADATRRLFTEVCSAGRTVVVPYGIDLVEIDAYRKTSDKAAARVLLGRRDDETMLLCLGTIEPRKGQTRIAQAFGRVAADHPTAHLAFVGDRGGAYVDALQLLIVRLGLEDRTTIVPVVADTYSWYRAADALVLASDVESLPRTALEAMAFDTPVAATAVFGLPELITDGENGMLCSPNSLSALIDMLDRVVAVGPDARASLGSAGRSTVERDHQSTGYSRAYELLIRGLVSNPAALPSEILGDRA